MNLHIQIGNTCNSSLLKYYFSLLFIAWLVLLTSLKITGRNKMNDISLNSLYSVSEDHWCNFSATASAMVAFAFWICQIWHGMMEWWTLQCWVDNCVSGGLAVSFPPRFFTKIIGNASCLNMESHAPVVEVWPTNLKAVLGIPPIIAASNRRCEFSSGGSLSKLR